MHDYDYDMTVVDYVIVSFVTEVSFFAVTMLLLDEMSQLCQSVYL